MTASDEESLPADVWQRMTELGSLLDAVSKRLKAVADAQVVDRAAARRTRQLAIGLAGSIVIDVLLTVVVAVLSASALNQGAALHASQLASCAISNETRAQQRQLWAYIVQVSGPPKSAAQKQKQQQFLTYVDTTFTPLDCAAIYKR